MTTYRKDVKKENNSFLSNADSHIYYQNEMRDYPHALHSRINCLVGFTVISLLIGSAALAISILLLLQAFDTMGQENARFEALQMRIKYLEHLTETLEPMQKNRHNPIGVKAAPTQPPTQTPTPPHLTLPPLSSTPPQEPGTLSPLPSPHPLPPPTITPQNDREMKPEITPGGTDDEDNTEANIAGMRRPLPPVDDEEEDADGDTEGSGEECPANPPRPICPVGMRLCTTKERCPKYVCCRH